MNNKRNIGIDLLRIVCMMMVVTLHVLGHGGIMNATEMFSTKYETIWLLEIFCICAVDCYAIISGYVMCESKIKFSNIVNLWVHVLFYLVSINILSMILVPGSVGKGTLFYNLFPVTFNYYWYFSSYFGMFLFLPFINKWIENTSKIEMRKFLFVSLVIAMTFPVIMQTDPFKFGYGYSMIWLIIMYILGAYIKRFFDIEKVSACKCIAVYVASVLFLWINKFIVDYLISRYKPSLGENGSVFIQYNSIFVIISAVALFLFFVKLDIKGSILKKIISLMSSVSFGVYLIHEHTIISSRFIEGISAPFATSSFPVFILKLLGTVVTIYLICSVIDYLRLLLFKALKVKNICIRIGDGIEKGVDKIIGI